jgi:hypothetical protein
MVHENLMVFTGTATPELAANERTQHPHAGATTKSTSNHEIQRGHMHNSPIIIGNVYNGSSTGTAKASVNKRGTASPVVAASAPARKK